MAKLTRTFDVDLDDHEMAKMAVDLAHANDEHDTLIARKKEEAATWGDKIKAAKLSIDEMAEAIRRGKRSVEVECREVMFPEDGIVKIQRCDNNEFTGEQRPMTLAEMQIPIPFGQDPQEGVPLTWPDGAPFERGLIVVEDKDINPGKPPRLCQVVWVYEDKKRRKDDRWMARLIEYGQTEGEAWNRAASALRPATNQDFDANGVEALIHETAPADTPETAPESDEPETAHGFNEDPGEGLDDNDDDAADFDDADYPGDDEDDEDEG